MHLKICFIISLFYMFKQPCKFCLFLWGLDGGVICVAGGKESFGVSTFGGVAAFCPEWRIHREFFVIKSGVCVCVCVIPKASKIDGKPDYLVVTILNPKQTLGQNGKNMQKWEWVKLVNDSGLRNEVGIHHSLSIHCAALWLQNYGCDWACDLKCRKFTSINGRIGRVVRPPGPVGVLDPARNPQMAVHIKMDRESPKSPKWPKFCSWICQILHVQGLNPNQILAPQFCTMLCLQYWHPLLLHSGVVVWKRYPAQRVGGRFSRLRCWVASLLSEGWWLWMDLERPGPAQRNQLASDGVMKKESEHSASMRQECLELYLPPGGERRHWDTSKKDTKKAPGSFQQRLQQKE